MIGKRLKQMRREHKLTQEQAAKMMGLVRSTYANYESGKREPDFETVKGMADFYGVTSSWLIGENKKENAEALPESEYERVISEMEKEYGVSLRDDPVVLSAVRQMIEIIAQTKRDKG